MPKGRKEGEGLLVREEAKERKSSLKEAVDSWETKIILMEAVGQRRVNDGDACSFSDANRFRYSIW
jgi:hypothetical protein